jgi:uncharacterized DUF497 family protein
VQVTRVCHIACRLRWAGSGILQFAAAAAIRSLLNRVAANSRPHRGARTHEEGAGVARGRLDGRQALVGHSDLPEDRIGIISVRRARDEEIRNYEV